MESPIELVEHAWTRVRRDVLSATQGERLHELFGRYIDVQFPSVRTQYTWELMPKGYVGVFPLDEELTIVARPKVPIANLAMMLAAIYELPVADQEALVGCRTMMSLYEQLAAMLARRVQRLARQGLHQLYVSREERLSAVRGRVILTETAKRPLNVKLPCRYSARTPDVIANRVPLWTLGGILHSGLCGDATRQLVRDAYRQLRQVVSLTPVTPADCDMPFDRLTERYRSTIALCRLFLENSGPVADTGPDDAPAFLLEMPRLFEKYVARSLSDELRRDGGRLYLETQERATVGEAAVVEFAMDIVVYDAMTRKPVCVLDTKYKDAAMPTASDVAQVGYYALLTGAATAGLVYPTSVVQDWCGFSGRVRTFRAALDLGDDLALAGSRLHRQIVQHLHTAH